MRQEQFDNAASQAVKKVKRGLTTSSLVVVRKLKSFFLPPRSTSLRSVKWIDRRPTFIWAVMPGRHCVHTQILSVLVPAPRPSWSVWQSFFPSTNQWTRHLCIPHSSIPILTCRSRYRHFSTIPRCLHLPMHMKKDSISRLLVILHTSGTDG